jgi:MFS family permease
VLDAYTLVVASLAMFAGSTSDRFGRRRIFQIGLFTAGSLLRSLAHSIGQLIAFRGSFDEREIKYAKEAKSPRG